MKFGLLLYVFLCIHTTSVFAQFPAYKNPTIPIENRITDLLSRLTAEEKVSQLLYNSPAIDRLDIQEYNWWNECLHGVARAGKATVFPQAIGMAATFDVDLVYRMADVISTEARAKYNLASLKDNRGQYMGLTFWTPNINIFRDPRWGRGQETYGEDPYLTGVLGAAFVKGLQGNNPQYLKAAACAKHFAVHSGPEKSRHEFNVKPAETDFRETYLPAFRALSDAGVESIMCAYNRIYDEPCCGSTYLLNDILREEFGFKGHIVSDCWALDDIWLRHKVVPTREEAAAMAAKAGVNLNCGYIYSHLPAAIKQGLIKESILDSLLTPLLWTRFKLGLFDPIENVPFSFISADTVNCNKHRVLAYEAASKSIVLLQNKNSVLPLKKDSLNNILIAGPVSADIQAMVGNYNGWSGNIITFLEGITDAAGPGITVDHTPGCLLNTPGNYTGFWQAEMADVVIVCLGNTKLLEGEDGDAMLNANGGDRVDLKLPLSQIEYITELRKKLPQKRIVAVITGGSAIALQEVLEAADAVLFAWYPGEQGGRALADILFGDVNPSGKLPVTFYKSVDDLPPFDDYSMKNRTYKFFTGDVLFPFGFGLSYTSFVQKRPDFRYEMPSKGSKFKFDVPVVNTGSYPGEQVIMVYASKAGRAFRKNEQFMPEGSRHLIAFKRVFLNPGEEKLIPFEVDLNNMFQWNSNSKSYVTDKGFYFIRTGGFSAQVEVH